MKPIYAKGLFNMSNSGEVFQNIIFYYKESTIPKEDTNEIKKYMQKILDNEKIFVNNKKVRPKVVWVNKGLIAKNVSFIHVFVRFNVELINGINEFKDVYESEISEYPYEIFWRFPGKVVYVKLNGKVKYSGKILHVKVRRGTSVGGTNIIKFSL